jgi:hypothetical protein
MLARAAVRGLRWLSRFTTDAADWLEAAANGEPKSWRHLRLRFSVDAR